jgi:peptide/nickel transport system substrate-binding protein
VHIASAVAGVNALRAGQVDMLTAVPYGQLGELDQAPLEQFVKVNPSRYPTFHICQTTAPFTDVRVRKALQLALDKKAINQVIFNGTGEVMAGLWPSSHPLHNDALKPYAYDPDQARKLLREAGVTSLDVTVVGSPVDPVVDKFFALAQAQYKAVGVNLTMHVTQNIVADFYTGALGTPRKGDMSVLVQSTPNLAKVGRLWYPGNIGNACNYNNPTLNAALERLRATDPGTAAFVRGWHELDAFVWDNALNVFSVFAPDGIVTNGDRVGGVTADNFVQESYGSYLPDVFDLYIKKGS